MDLNTIAKVFSGLTFPTKHEIFEKYLVQTTNMPSLWAITPFTIDIVASILITLSIRMETVSHRSVKILGFLRVLRFLPQESSWEWAKINKSTRSSVMNLFWKVTTKTQERNWLATMAVFAANWVRTLAIFRDKLFRQTCCWSLFFRLARTN